MSIELDINNYTINDLINFFKLQQTYTHNDLNNNEKDMTIKIISSDYEDNHKYNLLKFIQTTKNRFSTPTQKMLEEPFLTILPPFKAQ